MNSLYYLYDISLIHEPSIITFTKNDFITTKLGNRISRLSVLKGSDKIVVAGKTIIEKDVELHADLASIIVGRYCIFAEKSIIKPPEISIKNNIEYAPVQIGDYVIFEQNVTSSAANIGSYVRIGKNATIMPLCIIYDAALILENTHLVAGTIVPPFSVFGGNPGKLIGRLHESWIEEFKDHCHTYYNNFQCKD